MATPTLEELEAQLEEAREKYRVRTLAGVSSYSVGQVSVSRDSPEKLLELISDLERRIAKLRGGSGRIIISRFA